MKRLLLTSILLLFVPVLSNAGWTDNLILHIPFTNPSNPLQVLVGNGAMTYISSSSGTYIHPTTGLVTISTTNFALQSEDLTDSSWVTSSASVVGNQTTAPDGTVTADQFIVGASGDGSTTHSITMTVGSTAIGATSETYTASIYVKPSSNTWINLEFFGKNGTSHNCYFNTSTGAIGSCSSIESASTTVEANGFYRFSVTASLGATTGVIPKIRIYHASADGTKTFTGNGSNSVYLWGAQINSGGVSPYVRTTTTPVSTPRIESNGILLEGLRKNQLLWSRDLATTTWTRTNMNATKTATGRDGVVNSASIITATADNATVCQSITLASASTSVSADIKRITGTGAVTLSADNGSTYGSDVSSSLSTTDWYRAYKENQLITNPTFCIKLAVNGDSIAVDYTQLESGAFISSRIPTTGTLLTRYVDKLSIPSTNNWASSTGSFFVIADTWDTSTSNKFIMDAGGNPTKIPMHIRSGQGNGSAGILGRTTTYEGTECSYSSVNVQPKTLTKMASRWDKPNNTRGTTASGASFSNCTFASSLGMSASSTLVFGDAYLQDGTRTLWGHIKNIRAWDTALSESLLSLATAGSTNEIGSIATVTASSTATTTTTAALNAIITDTGGENANNRGFNYGTTVSYGATTTESGSFGTTSFSTYLTGLTCNTTYYTRAYASSTTGIGYSSGNTFTTASCPTSVSAPTVTASSTTATTTTAITLNANITATGDEDATARGFEYGTTVTYGATTTVSGTFGVGEFSVYISDLSCNTTYHYRAYATNSAGVGRSDDATFTTIACPSEEDDDTDETTPQRDRHISTTLIQRVNSIAKYSAQPNIPAVTAPVYKSKFTKDLDLQVISEDVRNLQKFLNQKGFFVAKEGPGSVGNETNVFGEKTKAALVRFQLVHDIRPASGYFGPLTRAYISSIGQ